MNKIFNGRAFLERFRARDRLVEEFQSNEEELIALELPSLETLEMDQKRKYPISNVDKKKSAFKEFKFWSVMAMVSCVFWWATSTGGAEGFTMFLMGLTMVTLCSSLFYHKKYLKISMLGLGALGAWFLLMLLNATNEMKSTNHQQDVLSFLNVYNEIRKEMREFDEENEVLVTSMRVADWPDNKKEEYCGIHDDIAQQFPLLRGMTGEVYLLFLLLERNMHDMGKIQCGSGNIIQQIIEPDQIRVKKAHDYLKVQEWSYADPVSMWSMSSKVRQVSQLKRRSAYNLCFAWLEEFKDKANVCAFFSHQEILNQDVPLFLESLKIKMESDNDPNTRVRPEVDLFLEEQELKKDIP